MGDRPLFQNTDDQERIYAPQQVPGEQAQVAADEGGDAVNSDADVPAAGPVASTGTSTSAIAATPNLGDDASGGAPGDPETEARYPIGDNDRDLTR